MTHPSSPTDLCARFQEAVRRTPDRVAVRDTTGSTTFAELDRATARLAGVLGTHGIGRNDRVGVYLPRTASLVVALLAVWRAGAAYVPLDPSYPSDRLDYMARDAQIDLLIADLHPDWAGADIRTVAPTAAGTVPTPATTGTGPDVPALPHQAAYVIYTSGSTGRPKGVVAGRDGVASLIDALERASIYASEPRVVAWNASVSFDASVQQWARICRGDTLVILDDEHRRDPAQFADWVIACGVTDLDVTPSHWLLLRDRLLADTADGAVLRLFVGGEPISEPVWQELAGARHRIEAFNLYGPTEATVDATAARVAGGQPSIGGALPGNRLHVLDGELREVAVGEPGELYIAGPRLAAGYHRRPGLTAQAFVADPFGGPGERMYRTGDQVRRTTENTFEFVGRLDRQVKLRGYRVELGEIDAAVRTHPGVGAAVTVVHDDERVGPHLVAYHVPVPGAGADAAELRAHAAAVLPEFMVPAVFVEIDALPLTANGKLDTAALPVPQAATVDRAEPEPMGELEVLIASVWSDVLNRDGVGPEDDFFALGGHSLLALRVVARLKKAGVTMPTRAIYQHPRLSDLARHAGTLSAAG